MELTCVILFIENYIDGSTIYNLVEDFKEFQQLVPQAGLRLKLKNLVESVSACKIKSEFVKYL